MIAGAGAVGTALAIEPGDRVLIGLRGRDVTAEEARRMREELAVRFPGVEFTFVCDVAVLARMAGTAGPVL